MKTIIITGVRGMDGSILADKYLEMDCKVIGVDRWDPTGNRTNIGNAISHKNFELVTGDITDYNFMEQLIRKHQPLILYNMASISLVPESFKIPTTVMQTNTMAVLNMLEAIRHYSKYTRFYQASSSEQIGENKRTPQNTESAMMPTSPYAVSKLASYHLVRVYRKAYGLFAVNGMLWNHEGSRRGPDFVTRKISLGVAKIHYKRKKHITLGNLEARRDWGYAEEYCEAIIKMMEADEPDDYAVGTGQTHSIKEFVEEAFKVIDLDITWKGKGLKQVGVDQNGKVRVKVSKKWYRPVDIDLLHGEHKKITEKLGWKPRVKFKQLVRHMVESDLDKTKPNIFDDI